MKRRFVTLALSVLLFIGVASGAWAEVRLDGYFIAAQECGALQSIRKGTNPGDIKTRVDMAYELLGSNKADATHYKIRVKEVPITEVRWVQTSCGVALSDCGKSRPAGNSGTASSPAVSSKLRYKLAITWQPAFCQNHQDKDECKTQVAGRYDATNFTLHGLWPQPRKNVYCNVSKEDRKLDKDGRWNELDALPLTAETFKDLSEKMPGVASHLQRHEWIKHGTCYSETPEEYFTESIMLLNEINASPVQAFFADNIGNRISVEDIRAKFDEAFGSGAGDKVNVLSRCGMITELWINLSGDITKDSRLAELLENAPDGRCPDCLGGLVDPVGY